jgi:hypothetical protein
VLHELTTVEREPAHARLEALDPWLSSLAYALVQGPQLASLNPEA